MDTNYNELFGIEDTGAQQTAQEPEGAEVTETAEPSTTNTEEPEGANEQETAEPAGAGEQPKEERSRYAAARRKAEAERDAAVQQAREDARREMDEAFKKLGLTNPYTHEPITSKAEFDSYAQQQRERQKTEFIRKSGMSEADFNGFIEQLPEVAEAKKQAEEYRAQLAKQQMEAEISEIGKLDPSIKSVQDLTKMENYDAFRTAVEKTHSFIDAYKLVNYERLMNQAMQRAQQQTAVNQAGKAHMNVTRSAQGAADVAVPEDVKAEYRIFMPDATDAEIAKHYNAYLKK